MLGLDDRMKYPADEDALVKAIEEGDATTNLVGSPSSVMKGVAMSVPQGTLGSSYEKTKVDLLALLYLVTSEYTYGGTLVYLTDLQHAVVIDNLFSITASRAVPVPEVFSV